ncbi:MAG: hypothetical protein Q4F84_04510, partial [Fibrobacter sp.]|nr:hypothetical protein [Fibrobacter sp.]
RHKLNQLLQPQSPFAVPPKSKTQIHWVKPCLVCEIKFSEWTNDNLMRHPVFEKIKDNCNPKTIQKKSQHKCSQKFTNSPLPNEQVITIDNNRLKLTNQNKLFWKSENITKMISSDTTVTFLNSFYLT